MTIRVLLIEDNPGDADLAREWLGESPVGAVDITVAATMGTAQMRLERGGFDAIVLDLDLPDSRGLSTLARARMLAGTTPIVVVSGSEVEALRPSLQDHGADEVLSKAEANSWLFSRCVLYVVERHRTQRRHAELAMLLETTPDAILVVGKDQIVRYVNQASEALFGLSRSELVGDTLGFSVKDGAATEIGVPRADGERVCEMRVVPMTWEGEPASLASIRDVTEARRTAELERHAEALEMENRRIQELNRMKSEFLANMSHELRTPLNAIIGFSQLLHGGKVPVDAPEHREFLGDILGSGRHLLHLINDILDLAKVEAGRMTFHPEPIRLNDAVKEVVAILRAVAAERRIEIRVELTPDVGIVHLDAVRFTQILYNFLSNALKFGADEGVVVVRTIAESPDAFRVEVQDDGDGIAPEDVGRLFLEFQQLGAGASRRRQGTGLGLAFTKRMVEAQGGQVGVETASGLGSTFYAVLPRRVEAALLEVL